MFRVLAVVLIVSAFASIATFFITKSIYNKEKLVVQDEVEPIPDEPSSTIVVEPVVLPTEAVEDEEGTTFVTTIENVFDGGSDSATAEEVIEEVVVVEDIPPAPEIKQRFTWILDAGHSALTKGKRSKVWTNGSILMEWEFNRDICARISRRLNEKGVSFVWINNTIDPVSLGQRVRLANKVESKLPTRILSIHANASSNESAHGVETWFYKLSVEGQEMAEIFQKHIVSETQFRDRGAKGGGFYILRKPKSPAVLTENGFFTNERESALMLTEDFRRRLADAHVRAILEIEGRKDLPNPCDECPLPNVIPDADSEENHEGHGHEPESLGMNKK